MSAAALAKVFTDLGFEVNDDYGTWLPLVDSVIIKDPTSNIQTVFKWTVTNPDSTYYLSRVGPELRKILLKGTGFEYNTIYTIASIDSFISLHSVD